MASGPVPEAITPLAHRDTTRDVGPKRGVWIGGPHLGRSSCVAKETGSLSLCFEHFFVVAVWLLLLVRLLAVVVVANHIVGCTGVSGSAALPVVIVHLLPCLLNGTRDPLSGPRCVVKYQYLYKLFEDIFFKSWCDRTRMYGARLVSTQRTLCYERMELHGAAVSRSVLDR